MHQLVQMGLTALGPGMRCQPGGSGESSPVGVDNLLIPMLLYAG